MVHLIPRLTLSNYLLCKMNKDLLCITKIIFQIDIKNTHPYKFLILGQLFIVNILCQNTKKINKSEMDLLKGP